MSVDAATPRTRTISIWWFALGYFVSYAPYSALAKALADGSLSTNSDRIDGFVMLPSSVLVSLIGMFCFVSSMRWWKFATLTTVGNYKIPRPRLVTLASGACTTAIVVTTTLAYTFEGISIVFAMLLMRGGVLALAPIVDLLMRRPVRWYSTVALLLSLIALVIAFSEKGGFVLSAEASIDIGIYLIAYFIRLRIMTGSAKSSEPDANKRYFVEEQMVGTPLALLALAGWATFGHGAHATALMHGFIDIWHHPALPWILLVGLCSQGTGIFGGLILLDQRENTFCVAVNRASSVLAGIVASLALWALADHALPSDHEWVAAVFILAAIAALSAPLLLKYFSAPARTKLYRALHRRKRL